MKSKGFNLRRIIENNTILLVFSFVCAIVLWFVTMAGNGEGRATVVENVPVVVQPSEAAQEAGVRIFKQTPTSADVSIIGSQLVTSRITEADIGITIPLEPELSMLTGNSMQSATLTLRAYKQGNTLADYEVESVNPAEVTVLYDRYKEVVFTVEPAITYTAAENYYASGTPTLGTDLLTVSGPESSVNRVARAMLIYDFEGELTESKSVSCHVTLLDINGEVLDPTELYLQMSDNTIDVSLQVTGRQTVQLDADIRNMPAGFAENRVSIEPASFEIAGDRTTISQYERLTLGSPINFYDVTPENNTFTVQIPVPAGVTNISNVDSATVTFNMNGYTESAVQTSNISVINAPEGKTAELSTLSLDIRVVGTSAQVSRLTADSVFCTVDLSSVSDPTGSFDAPVTVTINNADSCWAVGTYTANVTVADASPESAQPTPAN